MIRLSELINKNCPFGIKKEKYREIFKEAVGDNEYLPQYDADYPRWSTCTGVTSETRGFPCGLWILFHTIIGNAHKLSLGKFYLVYISTNKMFFIDSQFNPLRIFNQLHGWINTFYSCKHCALLYTEITTNVFPLNEKTIQKPEDIIIYLWKVHNEVNIRLKSIPVDGASFKKDYFPYPFVCKTCRAGDNFNMIKVQDFLIDHYGTIVPWEGKMMKHN